MISIVSCVAFAHIIRYGQERKRKMIWLGAFNYATAAAASAILWSFQKGAPLVWQRAVFGMVAGVGIVCAYLLLTASIRMVGVGISQCAGWMAVAVPVAASVFIWNEPVNIPQGLGLLLVMVSLVLLSMGQGGNVGAKSKWKVAALAGLFCAEGVINIAMKAFEESMKAKGQIVSGGGDGGFLLFMFGVAAAGNLIIAMKKEARPERKDMAHGGVLGMVNFVANFTLLQAIALMAGPRVFPTFAVGTVLLTASVSMLLWKERYGRKAMAGMALAAMAILLLSIESKGTEVSLTDSPTIGAYSPATLGIRRSGTEGLP